MFQMQAVTFFFCVLPAELLMPTFRWKYTDNLQAVRPLGGRHVPVLNGQIWASIKLGMRFGTHPRDKTLDMTIL